MQSDLLHDIDAFLKNAPWTETTFGRKCANDGKLIQRLRNGGQVLPSTEKRIREFMDSVRQETQQ